MPTLRKIIVQDFKNIRFQELSFSPNVNCISGLNGEGKTNLLEAIYYLSMTKSPFGTADRFNCRYGTDAFSIGGSYRLENETETRVSLSVASGEKKLIRDDKAIRRMGEHIGHFPLVMVSPGDSVLVSESGEDRRKLSNAVLSQMDREYLDAVQTYGRLLAQRNHILKDPGADKGLLEVIGLRMDAPARAIVEARGKLCRDLEPAVSNYYRLISGGSEEVSISYRTDCADAPLSEVLASRLERDLALGFTGSGPQRDDFIFSMNGHPLRRVGSQGQQKSFLVALKFAQYDIMKQAYGFPPMLLLDDIFDKLDLRRISNLVSMVAGRDFGQIFITDTDSSRLSSIVDRITRDRSYFETSNGEFHERV